MEPSWESEDQVSQHLIYLWEESQSADKSIEEQADILASGAHPDAGLSREEMREAVPV